MHYDKLIHLHIPKTGGTTLNALLENQFKPSHVSPAKTPADIMCGLNSRYRLFFGHFDWRCVYHIPGNVGVLTVLRHPIERLTSLYYYWSQRIPPDGMGEREATQVDFRTWASSQIASDAKNNGMTRILCGGSFVDFDLAAMNLQRCIFGVQEHFADYLGYAADTIGLPGLQDNRRLNQTPGRRPTKDDIPSDIRNILIERNRVDIRLYTFALMLWRKRWDAFTRRRIDHA